jgi:allantoicase
MTAFHALPDVASRALGGSVVHANDELFAARENLVTPGPPAFDPTAFGLRGKVYDGWETRRRRQPGNDFAFVRLGVPAVVEGVVVDTAHFTGNYPPQVSVDAVDLAALEHGGDVVACSDMFYAAARNLLMPGRARTTGEGWENARRRDGGNDHVTVRLAGPGTVRRLVVDTSCFVGNAPASVRVTGTVGAPDSDPAAWVELLAGTDVQPDTRHVFPVSGAAAEAVVEHVRVDVFPDGGMARFRVLGELRS